MSEYKKQASIQNQLCKYVGYCKKIEATATIHDLKTRLDSVIELYDEFKVLQNEIESKCGSDLIEIQYAHRGQMVDYYHLCVAKLKEAIEIRAMEQERNQRQHQGQAQQDNSTGSDVKLPRLTIPSFHGNYKEWPAFKDFFVSVIHENKKLKDVEKFRYLKDNIFGEASNVIKSLHTTGDNYAEAWKLITKRFEHKRFIVDAHLNEFFNQQPILSEDAIAIKCLVDKSTETVRALQVLGLPINQWDTMLVYVVASKLDKETHKQWELNLKKDELPSFDILCQFLENRWQSLEMITNSKAENINENHQASTNQNQAKSQSHKPIQNHQASQMNQARPNLCGFCNKQGHMIGLCTEFISLSYDSKINSIKSKKLCFNCLRPNHNTSDCKNPSRCQQCSKKHHTLIHKSYTSSLNAQANNLQANPYQTNTQRSNQAAQSTQNVSSNAIVMSRTALHATAIVNVLTTDGKIIIARALIDDGSNGSLIRLQMARQLGILQATQKIPIKGVGGIIVQEDTSIVKLTIMSRVDPTFKMEVEAYTIKKVSADLPSTQINRKNWPHLNGLKLADEFYDKSSSIDILLGVDVYEEIILDGIIRKIDNSPTAMNSRLGWLMFGKVEVQDVMPQLNSYHTILQDENLNTMLKSFWELEEVPQQRRYTVKEQQAEDMFRDNVSRLPDGRYQVALPFDPDKSNEILGESRLAALHCLYRMEKRFKTDQLLRQRYHEYIQNLLNSGHLELVPSDRMNVPTDKKFYLPHHAVSKESSLTTKLRVVFNASKKSTTGVSLNDKLLVGPTIQDDLFEILTRWRTHYVVFIADIEKMFRQIKLQPNQRDYQRILWRFSPNEPVLEYRITTVIDGTASASFLATRTLRKLAEDCEKMYEQAAQITKRDFYMDDVSSGSHDLQSAIKLQNELISMMNGGGFLLRKWYSNKQEILENVPIENRHDAEAIVELVDTSVKTLGIYWNQKSDCFQFKVSLSKLKTTITKREVLSDIAKLFDPIGWLSPSTVIAKVFMQSLWAIEGLDWDNDLPQSKYDEWVEFRNQLMYLENINLNRWIGTDRNCKIELYGFSDASNKAYAAVVFIRIEYEDGSVKVNLISGKTKVAPIKIISTPKLELCGCLLLSNLVNKVQNSFNFKDADTYLYSDSTICLAWITSHPNHWNIFVANRITEIQQLTKVKSWGFVDTENNPADCATRGVEPKHLKDHQLWWSGPKWLSQHKSSWPSNQDQNYETDEEKKKGINFLHARIQNTDLHMSNVLKSFSSLSALLKTTAFVLRWSPKNKDKPKNTIPKANEYRAALKSWIKCIQTECFDSEIDSCLSNDELPPKSKLLPLRPFLDKDGILRVGGRLSNSDLPFESKHPIIIPKRHHLTKLLIEQAHSLTLHGGPSLMSAFLNKYWIFGRSQQIRKVVSKCVTCYPFTCKPLQQIMADLPRDRVVPNRVFSHSGVDFAGPNTIKNFIGRSRGKFANIDTKAYIAIFVCLATKAVHIEFVSDMTSIKFIEAFKRFVARRGQVTDLYSDNGGNFVGANHILQVQMKELNDDPTVQNYFARQGTNWHFNPPASPHHGGLWEAGVKSIKYHLKRVIGNYTFTFEEMCTILCQIEACLNSRPLCSISDDLNEFNYLTPGHFIIGEPTNTIPEPSLLEDNVNRLKRWKLVQKMYQQFWHHWSKDYLSKLQQRPKWEQQQSNVKVGQLALYREENLPPTKWPLARILEIHPGNDNNTRVITLKTACGKIFKRPINKISILPIE